MISFARPRRTPRHRAEPIKSANPIARRAAGVGVIAAVGLGGAAIAAPAANATENQWYGTTGTVSYETASTTPGYEFTTTTDANGYWQTSWRYVGDGAQQYTPVEQYAPVEEVAPTPVSYDPVAPQAATVQTASTTEASGAAAAPVVTGVLGQSVATGVFSPSGVSASEVATTGLQLPVTGGTISSTFGPRSFDNHTGLDIAAAEGTSVTAAQAGVVTFAGWHAYGGGYRVEVTHASGVVTSYNHLSRIDVSVGQNVTQGEAIAAVGSTGNSTGPHLHFEVLRDGLYTNPATWLSL